MPLLSKIRPIEATVIPFPTELITPQVTKTYAVIWPLIDGTRNKGDRSLATDPFHSGQYSGALSPNIR